MQRHRRLFARLSMLKKRNLQHRMLQVEEATSWEAKTRMLSFEADSFPRQCPHIPAFTTPNAIPIVLYLFCTYNKLAHNNSHSLGLLVPYEAWHHIWRRGWPEAYVA